MSSKAFTVLIAEVLPSLLVFQLIISVRRRPELSAPL